MLWSGVLRLPVRWAVKEANSAVNKIRNQIENEQRALKTNKKNKNTNEGHDIVLIGMQEERNTNLRSFMEVVYGEILATNNITLLHVDSTRNEK